MQALDLQPFFQYLQTEKRYSDHTLDNYQRDIRAIRDCWLGELMHPCYTFAWKEDDDGRIQPVGRE